MSAMDIISSIVSRVSLFYHAYLFPQLPTELQTVSEYVTSALSRLFENASTDATSLLLLVMTLYFTLKLADFVRRSIMSWVFFMVKIGVILVVIQTVFYIHAYGWEKALTDFGWLGGTAWGWLEEMIDGGREQSARNKYPSSERRGTRDGKGWNTSGGRGGGAGARGAWL